MFKIGDKVRCIQDTHDGFLILNDIYTVSDIFSIPGKNDQPIFCLTVAEMKKSYGWRVERFELANKEAKIQEEKEITDFWDSVAK